ncbi:hypothetical protein HJFPF1_03688 [Paramyrothecium foliicola]|nr:hypothetical protein HJFPF1_03688 [Paramyrothecium foliicola]
MMSVKRELDDIDEGEIEEPDQKRLKRPQNAKKPSRQHQNSGIDPTWGQKYVFSSLADATTIPAGEESDFEDDADAMAYLMSVRQEASGIPHLLVAPKVQIGPQLPPELDGDQDTRDRDDRSDDDEPVDRSVYTNGIGDTRGYYEDGAYVARPHDWGDEADYEEGEDEESNAEGVTTESVQDAYHKALLNHYLFMRRTLSSLLPADAAARLPSSYSTHAGPLGPNSRTTQIWTRQILDHDPHPLQLAQLSKDSILRIIRVLLAGKFLRRGQPLPERTSRWLWALLARLPERGELNHVEIGWVRDLGRRAVLLGRSLAEMAALREELEEGGLGVNEAVDASSSDEDILADAEVDDGDLGSEASDEKQGQINPPDASNEAQEQPHEDPLAAEEGEVSDEEGEDVAMDLASDSDQEDGEVDEGDADLGDLQSAKARLLARLDADAAEADAEAAAERELEAARTRSRMNMRATICMILTVTGDFYGQRDLLEFREPFIGM